MKRNFIAFYACLLSALMLFSACSVQPESGSVSSDAVSLDINEASSAVQPDENSAPTSNPEPQEEEPVITQDQINPFTGLLKDESFRDDMRPIAIMVNNIQQSLPQKGLSEADIVYEIVTEGGITRLMAIFSQGFDLPTIGPVRSARDQHIQLMLSYQPLYLHIGSSAPADSMLDIYHYANRDVDGMIFSEAIWYDEERAEILSQHITNVDEHCWFTDGETLERAVNEYNLDANVLEQPDSVFDFLAPDEERTPKLTADSFNVKFSEYSTSSFEYNPDIGKYEKSIFGEPQIDANTGEQLSFKNVLILFTTISTYPDGILADVQYNFGGVGYYFTNGGYEHVRWLKGAPEEPLRIVSSDGVERSVEINPGNTYVAMVDLSHFATFAEFEMS